MMEIIDIGLDLPIKPMLDVCNDEPGSGCFGPCKYSTPGGWTQYC